MAKAEFLLQATQEFNHVAVITEMMTLPDPTGCMFSVGFVRRAGVQLIQASIKALSVKPRFFLGIRNDITSVQALHALLELNVDVYTVDTGSSHPIFHPKFYLITSETNAKVIIGSANLTHYGLQNNIEASAILQLDLKSKNDAAFVAQILGSIQSMMVEYPNHVQAVSTIAQADKLFEGGLLCDEDIVVAPSSVRQAPADGGTQLTRMKLYQVLSPPKPKKLVAGKTITKKAASPLSKTQFVRVWQSKPLMRRDLSIPVNPNSSPTYSMGLKDDVEQKIDRYTYFRHFIFSELMWQPGSKDQELAQANFILRVCGEDCGRFELTLSHVIGKKAATLKGASNLVTELRWGAAIQFINKAELPERTLSLYKKATKPPEYLIEIN